MHWGRTIGRYVIGALLVVVIIAGGLVVRMVQVGESSGPVTTADAIVVLGAAQYNGRPSPVFQARLDKALELYRSGVAPHVVTIGGGQETDATTEGEAGARYLVTAGVPEEAVVPVPVGDDTVVSLRAAAVELDANGWTDVVLVTDTWHMARSRMMARDLGLAVQVAPVSDGPSASPSVRTRYMLRELAGIIFYRLVGGSSGPGTAVL